MRKILSILFFGLTEMLLACSGYKITQHGKTLMGNNEDSWRQTAHIRFEPATNGRFGVAYVGYAEKQHAEGGINEHGLAYDAFTMPYNPDLPARDPNKPDFGYAHLHEIVQRYKTVDEVYAFLQTLNLHVLNGSPLFNGSMIFFVDSTGRYLVAEAHALTLGDDPHFLIANFSIANTKDLSTVKMARYCRGAELVKQGVDTSLAFCTALSDTMSVNRAKMGDGTLYTNVFDLTEGKIHLYFFS